MMPKFIYRNFWTLINAIISISISFCMFFFQDYFNELKNIEVIVGISGTMIGFSLTAISLFYGLKFNDETKSKIEQYGYHIIVPRLMTIALIAFILDVLIYTFAPSLLYLIIPLFVFGLLEISFSTYYLIVFSKKGG